MRTEHRKSKTGVKMWKIYADLIEYQHTGQYGFQPFIAFAAPVWKRDQEYS